ncbi:hypothetical protein [Limimonas halophila]|nr:hypothetical protein [Limimonas halophila]
MLKAWGYAWRNTMKRMLPILTVVAALAGGLAACDDNDSAGEQAGEAVEETGEAAEEAGEAAGEAAEETGEAADDAAGDGDQQ